MVEILIYSARLILLTSALKLVGHHLLDPIFVSACGLFQAFAVVFKSMKSKKNFYKLEAEDIPKEESAKKSQLIIAGKTVTINNETDKF
jgi:hypothetical protein